jgi:hypothetical protein
MSLSKEQAAWLKKPENNQLYDNACVLTAKAPGSIRRLNYSTLAVAAMLVLSLLGWLIGK